MAPSQNQQTQKPMTSDGAVQQPETAHVHELQTVQPAALQAMNPQKPHPEDENMGLRGGDRGGLCPGRFCFCVPCPLPCDCCII